jgi:hypothetical protein
MQCLNVFNRQLLRTGQDSATALDEQCKNVGKLIGCERWDDLAREQTYNLAHLGPRTSSLAVIRRPTDETFLLQRQIAPSCKPRGSRIDYVKGIHVGITSYKLCHFLHARPEGNALVC